MVMGWVLVEYRLIIIFIFKVMKFIFFVVIFLLVFSIFINSKERNDDSLEELFMDFILVLIKIYIKVLIDSIFI